MEFIGRNLRIEARMWTFTIQVNLWNTRKLLFWETACLSNLSEIDSVGISHHTCENYCWLKTISRVFDSKKHKTPNKCFQHKWIMHILCWSEFAEGKERGFSAVKEVKVNASGQRYYLSLGQRYYLTFSCAFMQIWSLRSIYICRSQNKNPKEDPDLMFNSWTIRH